MKQVNFSRLKPYAIALAMTLILSCKENNEQSAVQENASNSLKNAAVVSAVETNTSTHTETGFEDGNLSPFYSCTTQSPNYVQPFTKDGAKCAKFYWTQVGFDGTRMDKGAEFCSPLNFYKEGWYGFQFYAPTPGFPTNKETIIAQIFSEGTTGGGCSSWSGVLFIRNNALLLQRRTGCVAPVEVVIANDVQRNNWKQVVIHFVASRQNAGLIEIWYAGAAKANPNYRATNINFCAGAWVGDTLDSSIPDNMIKLKLGMYCHDSANYTTGEERILYYDNVSMLMHNPAGAWETVHPSF